MTISHVGLICVSGTIPATIGKLTSLQWLYLNSNKLEGTFRRELGCPNKLEVSTHWHVPFFPILTISHWSCVSGTIPNTIGKLTSLQYLYLYNNKLSGAFHSQWHPVHLWFNWCCCRRHCPNFNVLLQALSQWLCTTWARHGGAIASSTTIACCAVTMVPSAAYRSLPSATALQDSITMQRPNCVNNVQPAITVEEESMEPHLAILVITVRVD